MSKSNAFETALLALIFNGTGIADIADNDQTSPATSLYLSLHTADPADTGTQATNETAYTGYARKAVDRDTDGFTISGNAVTLVANQDFGKCTASPGAAITHFGIGVASAGATVLLYSGALSDPITMAVNVIPRIEAGQVVTED